MTPRMSLGTEGQEQDGGKVISPISDIPRLRCLGTARSRCEETHVGVYGSEA